MRRRSFIAALGSAITSAAMVKAQPAERRRVGVLMNLSPDDPEGQSRIAAFLQGLQQFGWTVGHNVQIDIRWGAGDAELQKRYARELVALSPDIVLASASQAMIALQYAAYPGPIVFVAVADPVAGGFVDSLSRPGGRATGFTQFEYDISTKWLELLKELAPTVRRAAVLRNQVVASGSGQFSALQGVANALGIELQPVDVLNKDEIERAIASGANDGVIVTGGGAGVHRTLIIALAARHRVPAVYPYRYFVVDGGLISYGPDLIHQCRQAAGYVDRILKGEKPAELPVQAPTMYKLVINLKTAKELDLAVPPLLLARADEVIE